MPYTIESFYDKITHTFSYLMHDSIRLDAAIIDPVLNFSAHSDVIETNQANEILETIAAKQLRVKWLLETHAHADHLSSATYLRHQRLTQNPEANIEIAIGQRIVEVQQTVNEIFKLDCDEKTHNIHLKTPPSEQEYLSIRETRDKELPYPQLLFPALQVNIRAGRLPKSQRGVSSLRIPLNIPNPLLKTYESIQ